MNVLSVAYPLLPVGPSSAGGAEQILFLVERGLVRAGHRSIVIAAEGSTVGGELIATPACNGEITDSLRESAQKAHLVAIERVLAETRVDLIHFHGLDFHAYVPAHAVPKLATVHLPIAWYSPSIFEISGLQMNCVSQAQAGSAPPVRSLPVVPNGVEVQRYRMAEKPGEFLLWVGRVCPEKGVDIALRVARALDLPLIVAGPVHPFAYHQAYFAEQVQPLLDAKRRYIGAVDLGEKVELYAKARCVLIPSLAPETSSLVAMEALSSGTPVIAFRAGALPEIVENGRTGFVVDSEEEMASAVRRTSEISPVVCRETAEQRFDCERMVRDYLVLYERLVSRCA